MLINTWIHPHQLAHSLKSIKKAQKIKLALRFFELYSNKVLSSLIYSVD